MTLHYLRCIAMCCVALLVLIRADQCSFTHTWCEGALREKKYFLSKNVINFNIQGYSGKMFKL